LAGNSELNVVLGNGDGTFQPPLPTATSSYATVAGDFNGDGILDLAVVNSSTFTVLLGNGDGTFLSTASYETDYFPNQLINVGDFNGDGYLDLAVGTFDSTQVFLGNGDGTFQPVASYGSGLFGQSAVGDFNGQGRLDLVGVDLGTGTGLSELVQSTLVPSSSTVGFPIQLLQMSGTPQTLTMVNVSAQPVTITSVATTGTNAADFVQNNTCGSSIAPQMTCTINITFTPTQVGPETASIVITDSAAGSPQSIALIGTGVVSGPNVTLSTTSISIDCILEGGPGARFCQCDPGAVTLSDFGSAALSISSITSSATFYEQDTCDGSVAAGNSCSITVSLNVPPSQAYTGTINISDNAPGSPQVVTLSSNQCTP